MISLSYYPDDARFYLKHEFEVRCRRRPHYSLRAFARDLEVSASTLSDFFQGRSGFSRERTQTLSRKLNLPSEHHEHFWSLLEAKFAKSSEIKKKARLRIKSKLKNDPSQLALENFNFIADWYHLAILEVIDTLGHKSLLEANSLSLLLGISRKEAASALMRLQKLGLLKKEDAKYMTLSDSTYVGEEVPSEAIRLFHHQLLAKAQAALTLQSLTEREFRTNIFSLRKSDMAEFKNDLNKMSLELITKYSSRGDSDAVYCLGLQLFNLLNESVTKMN